MSTQLTVVEKVIFLQDVDVFAEVPSEQLAFVAAVAEELDVLAEQVLYQEGEPSDSMYLVLDGKVRLHRGETEILVAGPRQAFGTWALFDDEPRVGAATVLEPTRLLRIDRDDFYNVLADNVNVIQGVMRAVVRRLRALGRALRNPISQG